jgi:putative isomerase
MDNSCRFIIRPPEPAACVDATSHVYWCRQFAAQWAKRLGMDSEPHEEEATRLREYIRRQFFCDETGWFHDSWLLRGTSPPLLAFEGMWPLVVGAATEEQADSALEGSLLNSDRFNSLHPISTIALCDPTFTNRMWRGPTWNSMTMWAVEACLRYGRRDGAKNLLEKSLDQTARQFHLTGTVWEFYDPMGGPPNQLERKPNTPFNQPCREYLGHNPLNAMARIWETLNLTVQPTEARSKDEDDL